MTVYYAEQSSSKHWFCWKLLSCQCTVYRVRKHFWIQNSRLLSDFFQKQYFIFTRFWYKRFLTQFKQHQQWNRAHSSHLMVVFQVIKFLTRIESRLPSSFAAFISSNTSRSALCCKKPGVIIVITKKINRMCNKILTFENIPQFYNYTIFLPTNIHVGMTKTVTIVGSWLVYALILANVHIFLWMLFSTPSPSESFSLAF